jgi:ATP-binding cassette, subfamily B, bacterial HlyB/CyaB
MLDITTRANDPGLAVLVVLMQFHGLAADADQIGHRFGRGPIGIPEMLRCAKDFKLKARVVRSGWRRLSASPLPAIACLRNGGFLIAGKAAEDQILVSDPAMGRPQMMSRRAFEDVWDGRLVFMARRANLGDVTNRFGIGWFAAAIHKYRRLIGESSSLFSYSSSPSYRRCSSRSSLTRLSCITARVRSTC